ncbi:hypothetical protein GQ53DRAFT_714962 [Thozetella sp. PMI_491]|nr:hypothetical protein GQ53DRAFT_714962 [Thozetella sp. PMI_491]
MAPYPASAAKPNESFVYTNPKTPFKYLTHEEAENFVNKGWLHVPNAINQDMVSKWMADLWVRSGYDEHDKSTWKLEYLHMPFHRQVRYEEFAPEAFKKITEIIGGEENWDPERERWVGDNFITNFGSEARSNETVEKTPKEKSGWHCDNDWFRQFLDSSGTALTVINCFTDIPLRGGGTWLCEDGLASVCKYLYDHPEGLEPALTAGDLAHGVYECDIFATVEAKKGDVFILHGLLPHAASYNYLHYARVITNSHVTLQEPLKLDRSDNNYVSELSCSPLRCRLHHATC